jgi:hypothetical protein
MTIVVTAKVTDGLVLTADSASTFTGPGAVKIYNNANKIFNLVKVWPIGAMVYGNGSIGSSSIETLTKDLRARLSNPNDSDYYLNRTSYTIEEVANKARRFLYLENFLSAYPSPPSDFGMGYRVCSYSSGEALPEVWEFGIWAGQCDPPTQIQTRDQFGVRWAGENEALDRLILGVSSGLKPALLARGETQASADALCLEIINLSGTNLIIPAMPIQDAIDVARFLVETATKFARYGFRPETIGGPTELAAITKHEGFKWVARKHYFNAEFNRETEHGQPRHE